MRPLSLFAASSLLAATLLPATSCENQTLTWGEANLAVNELAVTSGADGLMTVSVDLSTDFTLGQGVEAAADALADFARSQLPCSTVTVAAGVVTVDFGTLDDACVYRGETYAGQVSWGIESATPEEIKVRHTWTNFQNSRATLTGSSVVTWDLADQTRRVVHDAHWNVDGRTFTGTGDRLQGLLDSSAGIWGGIRIDGSRTWTSDRGTWDLAIEGVEVQWEYPLPRAGRYVLTNPDNKILTLTFELLDADTIQATVTGARRTYEFTVKRFGAAAAPAGS